MSQQVDGNFKTFVADAAIAMYALCEKTATGIQVAGAAAANVVGTATREAFAAGEEIAVKLTTAAGTHKAVASGAITDGAEVFAAADGKVAAAGTVSVGTALEAAAADGDVIEILVG